MVEAANAMNERAPDQPRPVVIEPNVNRYAEGSALIRQGHTHVLCTASVIERQPPHLRGTEAGWITAEYGMLPRATHTRGEREAVRGKQKGRTQEIQRLIGRALRAAVDLEALGPRTIQLDCDVLQADGGTRCAAITAGWVALALAIERLRKEGAIAKNPLRAQVAAISCGIVDGTPMLDLDYELDARAELDANFVMTPTGRIVELQLASESHPVAWAQIERLRALAKKGIAALAAAQIDALARASS